MRFADFTLEKYGAFDRRTLTIPAGRGLTVVYGPNEAGKSTCLSAIDDFLFGIPHNSVHGGVFGYDGMRLSATLTTADGESLFLSRRKGRGKTLVNSAGGGVDDAVLQAMLGSTTRDRFQTLFGLDHQSLRIGGKQLFGADGEIGRLIVEAGGGLRSLMARLDDVSAEADRLFSPHHNQNVAFYKLVKAFDEADRSAKAGVVTREAYEQTLKIHDTARETLKSLRVRKQELAALVSGIERLVRVVPPLNELGRIEADVAELASAGDLPVDFDVTVAAAIRARIQAASDLKTVEDELRELEERVRALIFDEKIIGVEGPLTDIGKAAIIVKNARGDRPGRIKELSDSREKLVVLKHALGVESDDDLAARLPSPRALDEVQRLVAEAMARGPAIAVLRNQVGRLKHKGDEGKVKLKAARAKGHDRPFGVSATDLATFPGRVSDLVSRQRQAEVAQALVDEAVQALGFASFDALTHLSCPSLPALQEEIKARDRIEDERLRVRSTLQTAIAAREAAKAEIKRLSAGEPVPTDAALAEERSARESAWAPVRTSYLEGIGPKPREARADAVDKVDRTIASADRLADRRAVEAQRIANLNLAESALAEAEKTIAASEAQLKDLEEALNARITEFGLSFPELAARRATLAAIEAFLERRGEIQVLDGAARKALADCKELEDEIAPSLELLAEAETKAKIKPPNGHAMAARVRVATQAIMAHDEAHGDYRRDLRDLGVDGQSLTDRTSELKDLEAEETSWAAAWPPAVATIGLPRDVKPTDAGKVVTEWAGARGVLGMIDQTQRRLDRMDEDESGLTKKVVALGTKVGVNLPSDPVSATEMLQRLWSEADKIRQKRAGLLPEIDVLKVRVQARTDALTTSQKATADLAIKARAADNDDDLKAAAVLFRRHADLSKEMADTVRLITSAGDGLDVDVLRTAWAGRDIDGLRAELKVAEDDANEIDSEVEDAIQAVQNARSSLTGFEEASGVNHAVAAREAAIAEIHRTIERYVELNLAHEAITRAITCIRNEQQDPLIRRAAELFALATKGEFPGIETDIDDKGQPVVVGRRASGAVVSVSAMSDGVRDQLFLAFRLASVESYCQATEPLPFIADDVLVHIDDPRSAATLDLLAEFGKTTQVLLFTHDLSVRDAAKALGDRAQIVELQ